MRVATSELCVNKPTDKALFGKINRSFRNVDISLQELADSVRQGFAFCAQHSYGKRSSANFTSSSVLAVDVDAGLRLEDALADPFIVRYGGFVYTTVSHTTDNHRFRIVFELEEPITDRDCMEHALTGLTARLGGDQACTDACRIYYGNSNAVVTFIAKTLPPNQVEVLALRGPERTDWSRAEIRAGAASTVTVHSRVKLGTDTEVFDATGQLHRLVELPVLTPIHCRMHLDKNASAFTIASRKGTPGVHCKTCNATHYMSAEGPYYDFDYDLKVVRDKSLEEWEIESSDGELLEFEEEKTPLGVHFICHEFLRQIETSARVVFVRSPKGTGKTEWLRSVVEQAKKTGKSILLVGHRQSLIIATADRLGLSPYFILEDIDGGTGTKVMPVSAAKHYAICVDSMPTRLDTQADRYDIVIIDEVEQVLAHLTSATLRDNRQQVILNLGFYLRAASKIYALDADLNRVTAVGLPALIRDDKRDCLLVVNDWKPDRGVTYLYRLENQIIQVLLRTLDEDKRCFVCTNSKSMIKKLAMSLQERYGDAKAFRWITSENSQQRETQAFLQGLPATLLSYDALLVSPAVGTGVDITFGSRERKVDAVFGLFRSHVNTHFDMDQQLCRVRHPGEVHVWISPERFSFETNPELIRKELEASTTHRPQIMSIDDEGRPQYSPAEVTYAEIYSEVQALQRASKNNLLENFCDLRRQNGWEIIEVERCAEDAKAGRELVERGAELVTEDYTHYLLAAAQLSTAEYERLRRKEDRGGLTERDAFALRRYEIERFYLQPISDALIELDDDGRYRRAVRLFETLRGSAEADGETGRNRLRVDTQEASNRRDLLRAVFSSTPLYTDGSGFDVEIRISQADLEGFVEVCRARRLTIERSLETSLRSDLHRKPAQQRGALLKLIGLRLNSAGTQKDGQTKIYFYSIDRDALAQIEGVVSLRSSEDALARWNRERDSDTTQDGEIIEALAALRRKKQPLSEDLSMDDAEAG